MRMTHTIFFNDQLLYSLAIHVECDALFQNKINDSYLNQEYSVLGNSSTFKYTCLFADFCGLFKLPQPDRKTAASVV